MLKDTPILYVDDDVDSREVMLLWLKMQGCKAVAVSSCAEALQLIEEKKFHLCIVDYRLPDCTGVELCQKVRQKWPTMPFILNSCDTRQPIRTEAAVAGMHFLPKPTDLDLLHRLVESIVHCASDKAA